jgi:hypothetical protein
MQATTVMARLKSSVVTLGVGNPLVALAEAAGAIVVSIVAVLAPIVCVLLLAAAVTAILYRRARAARRS